MAPLFKILTCFVFFFKTLSAEQSSSFSFKKFGKDSNFESNIGLYGDARVVSSNGSWIQLTDSVSLSVGAAMYKKPIKLVEGKVKNFASFSTYFSFSMSRENGDGLAFIIVPSSFEVGVLRNRNKTGIFAVEFDSFKDVKHGDLNESHVRINGGRNLSSLNLVLNNGQKFHSWIDYEASSKRLEIRLNQSSSSRPIDPLLSYKIDLSKLWSDEKVFVGLSSSNGNSSQSCFVHSWSFKLRRVPNWMHSQPLDPKASVENPKPLTIAHKCSKCFWKVILVFVWGGVCGTLAASCLLYLWTIFGDRRPVVPEKCGVDSVDFEYKNVKVVVIENAIKDGKK